MTYADDVGERLRQVRTQQGMSLQDVERASDGVWKAAVVGSYERGDRNISASRLCELAEFYGVGPTEILPARDVPAPLTRERGLVIDLSRLHGSEERWRGVRRFCESIQVQRGDYNRRLLSLRTDDVRALAVIHGTSPDRLVDDLRGSGILMAS